MNNRDYKNFTQGEIYHTYNRGVGKMDIFRDTQDYLYFLLLIKHDLFPAEFKVKRSKLNPYVKKQLPADSFDLIGYCLMPNHFHLLIRQNQNIKIGVLIKKITTSYAIYFNKKYERVGTLFQGRFKAVCVGDNRQLKVVFDYIHNNPVRSELVQHPAGYFYSSYNEYYNKNQQELCKIRKYDFLK